MKEKSKPAKEKEKSLDELDTDVTLNSDEEAEDDELEDDDGDEEEADGQGSTAAEAPTLLVPGALSEVRPATGSKAEIMKRKLMAQQKVPIMIPLSPGESVGSTYPAILNGYRLNIKKGTYVHVPLQVARVVMRSQQQTQEAISNYFLMNDAGISQAMRDKGVNS
jgi:hypothetical protein